jgi:hypothetical protein
MRIPLSRIEYEYVLETFLDCPPPLLLQTGTLFYAVTPQAYTIKQSRLYCALSAEYIGKKVAVFFEHKKRSIVFFSIIYHSKDGNYLQLPDIAYKYDADIQKRGVHAEIVLPKAAPITAQEHENFPLDSIIHTDVQLPAASDFLPSAYQMALQHVAEETQSKNNHAFPLFLYRLHEFERHVNHWTNHHIQSSLSILFIDSKLMLCGCKDSYAVTIGRRQSLQFVLYFPHRTIRILKGRSLFSHFIPKSNGAVLGFLFEEIFEEDKRFLYEQVYHEKYNPLNF